MKKSEMIAQLEPELESLKAALAACTPKTDPAICASLKRAIERWNGSSLISDQVGNRRAAGNCYHCGHAFFR